MLPRESLVIAAAGVCADAGHWAHEVIDHSVGIGMIDVEAVEFAIGRQVDRGLALDVEYDARGIETRLFARQRRQPIWDGVGTDGGGED
jgi:hypothetical protein